MKTVIARMGVALFWIVLGISAAALYGILNDQITVTLSPEYFSVFKRQQFSEVLEQTELLNAPTRLQAVLVGALATWWFGLFLSVVLSICGMAGHRPPLGTRLYLQAIAGIMLFTLALSVFCGTVGYLLEPFVKPGVNDWPFLKGIHDVRRAFAIGFWHDGAYLGGFIGTILAGVWAKRKRTVLRLR